MLNTQVQQQLTEIIQRNEQKMPALNAHLLINLNSIYAIPSNITLNNEINAKHGSDIATDRRPYEGMRAQTGNRPQPAMLSCHSIIAKPYV